MSTSSQDLTDKEEQELSDERVLNDIRRSLKAREASEIGMDIDVRALAIQGVEKYWLERDILAGIVTDEEAVAGRVPADATAMLKMRASLSMGDDIAMSFRLASRKLADLQNRFVAEKALLMLPVIVVGLVLLIFPSFPNTDARLFKNDKLAQSIGLCAVLLACLLGLITQRQREYWMQEWRTRLRYLMGFFAGIMFASALLIIVGLQRVTAEKAFQQEIGSAGVLDRARDKIEAGRFDDTPQQQPEIITLANKKTVKMRVKEIKQDGVVYWAEGEGLPSPVEIQINKNSGEMSLVKEDGNKEKTAEFFVGNIATISENKLELKVKDEQGNDSIKSVSRNSLKFDPIQGERVFVTIDPVSQTATGIEKVAKEAPAPSPEGAKKGREN